MARTKPNITEEIDKYNNVVVKAHWVKLNGTMTKARSKLPIMLLFYQKR